MHSSCDSFGAKPSFYCPQHLQIRVQTKDEIDIDQEFKMELEQSLQEATQSCRTEVIQALKKELLKHF